ncbi:MAG: response regulator [Clostridiales bacterium]
MENKHTILLVDDELDIQKITIMILEDAGYNVMSADNGLSAIEIIKKNTIDILLIDYFMAPVNGEDTIKEIRKFNSELLIIMQTAYSGEKPANEMLHDLDIQNYYDKSHGVEGLLLMIKSSSKMVDLLKKIKESYELIELENKKKLAVTEVLTAISENLNLVDDEINKVFKSKSNKNDEMGKILQNIYNYNNYNKKYILRIINKYKNRNEEDLILNMKL